MRRQIVLLLALVAWNFGGTPAHANFVQCNYDFTNTGGQEFFDLEVVLKGTVTTNGFYNPYFNNHDPIVTTSGGTTSLHWVDPTNPILNNTLIHVGYTPVGTDDCPLLEVHWTDKNHNRVSSSFIGVVYNHLKNTSQSFTNTSLHKVDLSDIRMACQTAPLPLDALNASNDYLAAAMVPITDKSFTLEPGESVDIPVQPSCADCYCVTNFKTSGEGLDAIFSPWVQEFVK
jgi:hypothetical protein